MLPLLRQRHCKPHEGYFIEINDPAVAGNVDSTISAYYFYRNDLQKFCCLIFNAGNERDCAAVCDGPIVVYGKPVQALTIEREVFYWQKIAGKNPGIRQDLVHHISFITYFFYNMNHKVDFYFDKPGKWQKEITQLRKIVLDCGLTETLKWGCPCYTFQPHATGRKESNIVLIHVFREYCALLFFKGALLKDTNGLLIQQTKNVQSARQIRFTGVQEIVKMTTILKAYIHQAIAVEEAGLKVELKKTEDFSIPEEFQYRLDKNRNLKMAFENLTPGRQRAYLFYFAQPKQSKTRESRVEKYIPRILKGKGLND